MARGGPAAQGCAFPGSCTGSGYVQTPSGRKWTRCAVHGCKGCGYPARAKCLLCHGKFCHLCLSELDSHTRRVYPTAGAGKWHAKVVKSWRKVGWLWRRTRPARRIYPCICRSPKCAAMLDDINRKNGWIDGGFVFRYSASRTSLTVSGGVSTRAGGLSARDYNVGIRVRVA